MSEKRKLDITSVEKKSHPRLQCDICRVEFVRRSDLTRHVLSHSMSVKCGSCGKQFRRKDSLARHIRTKHRGESSLTVREWQCTHCARIFSSYTQLYQHVNENHPLGQRGGGGDGEQTDETSATVNDDPTNTSSQSALGNTVQDHTIEPNDSDKYDMLTFYTNVKETVEKIIKSKLTQQAIKWYLSTQVQLYKENAEGEVMATVQPHFRSKTYTTLNVDTYSSHVLNESFQKMSQSLETYLRDSSGWIVGKVIHLKVHTVVYSPLRGSSYIPLPLSLCRSNSILNVENHRDEKCFTWSILSALYPTTDQPEQVRHYEHRENELNMSNIVYPVSISQVDKFETQNPDISVNVFAYESSDIIPLKISSNSNRRHHVNLLLLKNEKGSHYCLIRDLDKFLSRTKSCKNRHYFCSYCLHGFTKKSLLEEHIPYCSCHGAQKVVLPNPGENILKFKDFEKQLKVPFVIYSDFETLNKRVHSCSPNPSESGTTQDCLLEPCSFAYKIVSIDPKYTKPTVVYRGPDAAKKLIDALLKERSRIEEILEKIEPIHLTPTDQLDFIHATTCSICSQALKESDARVRHHCHVTGKYLGCAHSNCNLQCKQAKFIPVIFHNLKNFDAHCLCQGIGVFKDEKIECIPQNLERYVSFSISNLRFIDSYQFLPSSLESLVDDLVGRCENGDDVIKLDAFPNLLSEFPSIDEAELLVRKGIYPYEFMTDESKFQLTHLPPIEAFYSTLTKEHITSKCYEHAQAVFRKFKHKNLGEYHDTYLRSDVLLLADVFQEFRSMCLKYYELDPCHYYTLPGLSWSAMLKNTGVELELITDVNQMNFVESGIRGGVCQVSHRYHKANNVHLDDYDANKATSYLVYIDCNGLYSWAMCQMLPKGGFKWLSPDEISGFDVQSISPDSPKGYILQVDLKYDTNLHSKHNSYPLGPELGCVATEELSPYALRVLKQLHGCVDELPPRPMVKKLLTTLKDKHNYILHYRTLQLYLELGMELKAVHRVLEFDQEAWMEPYIRFNMEKRREATSTFQKALFKLACNACYGKTMECVRRHRDVKLCHTKKRIKQLAAKTTYKCHRIFSEDLVAVELTRAKVVLNKPIYCGMAVLEHSKHLMYTFWYKELKKMYGENIELAYTDTDSFIALIYSSCLNDDLRANLELFDTSDFPRDHELYSDVNKKVPGKFKFETNEKCISEFVGLRPKMYALTCAGTEQKRCKGISKSTVEKELSFDMYKNVLTQEGQCISSMTKIASHGHLLHCETVKKVSLSCYDDKRWLHEDGVSSYAYGHIDIPK